MTRRKGYWRSEEYPSATFRFISLLNCHTLKRASRVSQMPTGPLLCRWAGDDAEILYRMQRTLASQSTFAFAKAFGQYRTGV